MHYFLNGGTLQNLDSMQKYKLGSRDLVVRVSDLKLKGSIPTIAT